MTGVRVGRPDDLARITEFTTGTFSWGDYVADTYLEWLRSPDQTAIVAVDANDQPLALVHVQLLSDREGWLSAARVDPDHRRQGLGSVLNQAGVDWLAERGALVVRLTTEESNHAARAQVEKLGYRRVASFALGARDYERHGAGANGGRRLQAPERFEAAPSAEAEAAFLTWSSGDLNRYSHGLYGASFWAFRRLTLGDLAAAAKARRFWASPSGWCLSEPIEDKELWVSLLLTTPDDAGRAARALADLAEEMGATRLRAMVPRVDWLESALALEHIELTFPNWVYEKAIT